MRANSDTPPTRGARGWLIAVLGIAMVALTGFTIGFFPSAKAEVTDPALVRISQGALRGAVSDDSRSFSGIPYAAPPVGEQRWRAPQPPDGWSGVRDATTPGERCPQLGGGGPDQPPAVQGNEDCLYLNVTTPAAGDGDRPVMVWFHGGGFVSGAGSDYDPARLAAQGDLVVVTANYRLGALGGLAHPALRAEDPAAGNYMLADQQAVLRWVRDNAAAFGGDPGNVTIAGQSSGGYSVCAHLASPGSRRLFDKAVVQSSPCANEMLDAPEAEARGEAVAEQLGCTTGDVAACLRGKPLTDLVGLEQDKVFLPTEPRSGMPWQPVAGTSLLPKQFMDAVRDGTAAEVPLLQGATRDELRPFIARLQQDDPITVDGYQQTVRQVFGDRADAVLARYPADAYPSPGVALATVLSDWGRKLGACPVLPTGDAAARRAPVYTYEFAEDSGKQIGDFPLGTPHSAELAYLFELSPELTGGQQPPLTPAQQQLSETMTRYWARFAHTGDPNGQDLPRWRSHRRGGPVLGLASGPDGIAPVDFADSHQCGFWNAEDWPRLSGPGNIHDGSSAKPRGGRPLSGR